MTVKYHTQAINDEPPIVVVFTSHPTIAAVTKQYFSSLSMDVVIVSTHLSDLSSRLQKIPKSHWYKCIWWDDLDVSSLRVAEILAPFFHARSELSYILLPIPLQNYLLDESKRLIAQGIYYLIERKTPYTSMFGFYDLLDQSIFSWRKSDLLHHVSRSLQDRVFSAPAFLTALQPYFFSGRGGQRKLCIPENGGEKNAATTPFVGEWKTIQVSDTIPLAACEYSIGAPLPRPAKQKKNTVSKKTPSTDEGVQPKQPLVPPETPHIIAQDRPSVSVAIPVVIPPKIHRSKLILDGVKNNSVVAVASKNKHRQHTITRSVTQPSMASSAVPPSPEKRTEILERIDQLFATVQTDAQPLEKPKPSRKQHTLQIWKKMKRARRQHARAFVICSMLIIFLGGQKIAFSAIWYSYVHDFQEMAQHPKQLHQTPSTAVWKLRQSVFAAQLSLYSTFIQDAQQVRYEGVWGLAGQLISVSQLLNEADQHSTQMMAKIFDSHAPAPTAEEWKNGEQVLQELSSQLHATEALTKELVKREVFEWAGVRLDVQKEMQTHLAALKKNILIHQQLWSVYPQLFSAQGVHYYAVLLQDNLELRPSGGFLAGVAVVQFKNGKYDSIQVFSSDEIDQNAPTVMEPPTDLQALLGEKKWYFRDSNWGIEGDDTARRVAWYLEQTQKIRVEGVVFLNPLVVQSLLGPLQSVTISSTGETVTNTNVLDRLYSNAMQAVKTQTSQHAFLIDVYTHIWQRFLTLSVAEQLALATQAFQGLVENQIAIVPFTPSLQSVFLNLGWMNKVIGPSCPTAIFQEKCYISSVYQVNSNISFNKLDNFIKKRLQIEVSLKEPKTTISKYIYTYASASNYITIDHVDYRVYSRFTFPKRVSVVSVMVNDRIVPANEVYTEAMGEYVVVGVPVVIDSAQPVSVVFTTQEELPNTGFSYGVFSQKQAGVDAIPTSIVIEYGKTLTPQVVAPSAEIGDGKIVFQFTGEENVFAGVKFK